MTEDSAVYHRTLRSRSTAAMLGAAFVGACSDQPAPAAPDATPAARAYVVGTAQEMPAASSVARAVAIALNDQGLRARLHEDLRRAPNTEHKLDFRSYLKGTSGGILLSKMATETGQTREQLLATVEAVRPLEFYMPVQEHRESWTGKESVLVAAQLEDGPRDPIVAFDASGASVAVTPAAAPVTPTLVIVPVETHFAEAAVNAQGSSNVGDRGGMTIGTLRPRFASYGIKPAGLYMTFSRIVEDHEPWSKGDPELEVHVHGPTDAGNPQYGADLACAGQHAAQFRTYNQDNAFWNGEVLLFTEGQILDYNAKFGEEFGKNVVVWEDDDTACQVKNDNNELRDKLQATSGAAGATAVAIKTWGQPVTLKNWAPVGAAFLAALYASASWLLSNDDMVGTLVRTDGTTYSYTDANHVLLNGSSVNGRAMLKILTD